MDNGDLQLDPEQVITIGKFWEQCHKEWEESYKAEMTVEERLAGLSAGERLEGLSTEERLEGIAPEERLQGLTPEQIEAYLQKLKQA